ncbi:hypothetical protein Y1Q_0022190 [Alligator mississippiensis]|uniref:Secreted protein n=1 Tax=Alligator mississippiensis TaxID=8496 RepID=A0A151P0G1_ALLMI|nr:hypothetical protein Y1Q_0022190 [Alligator mississippiensis]
MGTIGWQCNMRSVFLSSLICPSLLELLSSCRRCEKSAGWQYNTCPTVFISSWIRLSLPELHSSHQRCEKPSG